MFNITDCIAVMRDADTIVASKLLTNEERGVMLGALVALMPPAFNRPHIGVTAAALDRLYEPYRPAQARPTEGEQDTAPVGEGPGVAEQAPQGPTEGEPEQAKDAGSVLGGIARDGTPREAPAPAEKRPARKARK